MQSLLTMKHRGPNAQIIKQVDDKTLLGHLRLSIIDLGEQNNQPFVSADGLTQLVFNGEIYNYIEIRAELLQKGYIFKTNGDTEVLLQAYIEWGQDCVKKFNGMWSFVIYDKRKDLLFCSRDRFGVKPFNYAVYDNQFIFSSEIKPIINYFEALKQPNYEMIVNFCQKSLGAQLEYTWFKEIFHLMPAHNMTVFRDGRTEKSKYWHYPTQTIAISLEEATNKYRELFIDAVKLRMRSDVPVGTTLSSGVDSTSIVYALRTFHDGSHNTYSAFSNAEDYLKTDKQGYASSNTEINEIDVIRQTNKELGFTGHPIDVDYNNYVNRLRTIIHYLESGHPSPAIVPLDSILEKASQDVIVVLEGQGADELLGGYLNVFMGFYGIDLIKSFKFRTLYNELSKFKKAFSVVHSFKVALRAMNSGLLQKIYQKWHGLDKLYLGKLHGHKYLNDTPLLKSKFGDHLSHALYEQHAGTLSGLLHYGDAISMKHSLESRLPFMDYRLVEFCFQLPSKYKIKDGFGKYIHRKALLGIAPEEVLFNRIKYGFNTPISKILNDNSSNSPCAILLDETTRNRGLFDMPTLKNLITSHQSGKPGYANLLFRLLNTELWFREFID